MSGVIEGEGRTRERPFSYISAVIRVLSCGIEAKRASAPVGGSSQLALVPTEDKGIKLLPVLGEVDVKDHVLSFAINPLDATAVSDAFVIHIIDRHIAPEWTGTVGFSIHDGESTSESIVIHGPRPKPVLLVGICERILREEEEERQS